ncbi:MAG: hypothetical protein ACLPIC_20475 [Rhodoblastus sp.]|uniref:hypothetical protein n=1 Tax=Rhodoblastus sp. TaxID=1962975 RepID=UPI003F96C7E6
MAFGIHRLFEEAKALSDGFAAAAVEIARRPFLRGERQRQFFSGMLSIRARQAK